MKIILIHGMAMNATINFFLLERHLKSNGYTNIHKLSYDSMSMSVKEANIYCYQQILHLLNDDFFEPIVLIGYSLGGVISYKLLDTYLNIILVIFIASPLKSCDYLENMPYIFKKAINLFNIPVISDLDKRHLENITEPEIPYYTITAGLAWNDLFDGKIYKKDAIIKEEQNIHLKFCSHFMLAIDRRCFKEIVKIFEKEGIGEEDINEDIDDKNI